VTDTTKTIRAKRAQATAGALHWETVGLGIAIAAAVAVAVTGYRTTQELAATTAEVDRTHRTIEALDEVVNEVGAAGTARRSFLFGGEGAELERFDSSSASAREALAQARSLAAEAEGGQEAPDADLQAKLDRVAAAVEQRLTSLDESVRRHQRGLGDDANEPPTRADTELVASLRQRVAQATSEPRRHLAEQERLAARTATVAKQVDWIGTALGLVVVVFAFTSLRREAARERAARRDADRATRFLDSLIENLPAMVFVKDAATLRFERINRAGEALLGVPREALVGKTERDLFPEEQARSSESNDKEALATANVVDVAEEPIDTKDGRRWLHTRKVPLFDGDEGPARFLLGISEDITARKASAEALEAAKDRAEAVGRELEAFSYSVAHDLRTPLRSIDGFSRLVLDDYPDALDAVGRGHLLRVIAAAHRMSELIDDLLALSRITRARVEMQEVDISAIATGCAAGLQSEHETPLEIAPALKSRGDPRLLRIVFDNLLDNAFKFTAGRPGARIEVGETTREGRQAFFVRDTGAGFDSRFTHKLFGAFQRLHDIRDYPGTGIGLATVQRIVNRHGGKVWAEGEVGRGATFTFTLSGDGYSRPPLLPEPQA
jgi:PAS domain S-box-containing protein